MTAFNLFFFDERILGDLFLYFLKDVFQMIFSEEI